MANRPKGYGFSGEIANKMNAKYSEEDESEVRAWVSSIISSSPSGPGREAFHAWLKDGTVLCELMKAIQPGCIKKTHDPSTVKMAAMRKNKEMENISFFLNAAEKYGVAKGDLFQTVDLYENQNMAQVLTTLYKLSSVSLKNGYTGPQIGVKLAEGNKRDLDEQKLREGRNVIGLQMGTNQGASQRGMTPYGLGRQLTPQSQ